MDALHNTRLLTAAIETLDRALPNHRFTLDSDHIAVNIDEATIKIDPEAKGGPYLLYSACMDYTTRLPTVGALVGAVRNLCGPLQPENERPCNTAEPAARLRNLRDYMPSADERLCLWARFLATQMNPRLNPIGVVVSNELAVTSCLRSQEKNGHPLPDEFRALAGGPPVFYNLLRMQLPGLVRIAFPEAFAARVCAEFDRLSNPEETTRAVPKAQTPRGSNFTLQMDAARRTLGDSNS